VNRRKFFTKNDFETRGLKRTLISLDLVQTCFFIKYDFMLMKLGGFDSLKITFFI